MRQLKHEEFDKKQHDLSIIIVCDKLNSAANLGSIFRTAEAFGVSRIYIHDNNSDFLTQARFKRTARHSFRNVEIETYSDSESVIRAIKNKGFFIISLEKCDESTRLQDIHFQSKTTLIVGNEISGVHDSFLNSSDAVAHIDMFGENSSMNVSQATGISLFECVRQQLT